MQHMMENDVCLACNCTKKELDEDIAPPDCLGPAGQSMRREAYVAIMARREAETKARFARIEHAISGG